MLPEKWQKLQELFEAALEHDPDARPSFLEQACGGDDLLRRRVESLLHSFEQDRSFLETPAVAEATDALRETIETALRRLRFLRRLVLGWAPTRFSPRLVPGAWARCIGRTTRG